ncbi:MULTISPECIES: hypothetical protein [Bacillus]|nr:MULTISPECIES: hypothetical protein [Bacillus]
MYNNLFSVDQMLKERGIEITPEYAKKQLARIDGLLAKLEARKNNNN